MSNSQNNPIILIGKKIVIVPFQCINIDGIFRYKNKWWTKRWKLDALNQWGPLGICLSNNFELRINTKELVAAPIHSVCSTEYHQRVDIFDTPYA